MRHRLSAVFSGWGLTGVSLLCVTSSAVLIAYLDWAPADSIVFDALKSLLFWGDKGAPVMHAPPFINLSQVNTLVGWLAGNAIAAAACLVRALYREPIEPSQPRAATVMFSLLALYCVWRAWPPLALVIEHS